MNKQRPPSFRGLPPFRGLVKNVVQEIEAWASIQGNTLDKLYYIHIYSRLTEITLKEDG